MLGTHFYNEAISKTIKGFGTLFNNITLVTSNPQDGSLIHEQKVPLGYGPKNKYLTRIEENPELRKVAITLPRIYFEMTGIQYDAARKTSPIQKYKKVIPDNGNEVKVQYVPIPYNVSFELGILAKSQTDALQILEQILAYFQPNFNITIDFIPDMEEKRDVSIILNNVDYSDEWNDDFNTRRIITWTLQFTAKSYIYGPFNQSGVIRKVIVDENYGDKNNFTRSSTLTYQVKALEDLNNDNVINQLDDQLVTADDDFGFSGEIVEY